MPHSRDNRPEWKIIIDLLKYTDKVMLERIARKMMVHLFKYDVEQIKLLIGKLTPNVEAASDAPQYENKPSPKRDVNALNLFTEDVFHIAEQHLTDEEITMQIHRWLRQEKVRFLSSAVEQKNIPLYEVMDIINQFLRLYHSDIEVEFSPEEKISARAALARRFLSDQLDYINVAKMYISIRNMGEVLDNVVGIAQGTGKLGGKSAGIILASKILDLAKQSYPVLENVRTPISRFITSDSVLDFIHYNMLEELTHLKYSHPNEIRQEYPLLKQIFKHSFFSQEVYNGINKILDSFPQVPLIVRSSSLLEDQFGNAFSGKYKSLFIANQGPRHERLAALCDAISEVYASTFSPDAITYRQERGLIDFQEEMGILVQQVVGNQVGKYFFPSCAGVAFSNNEFRWSPRIKRDDGLIRLVMGLGTRAVDRTGEDYPVLISPGQPNLRANTNMENLLRYSQIKMDVMNLETNTFDSIDIDELIKEYQDQIPLLDKMISRYQDGNISPISPLFNEYEEATLIVTFEEYMKRSPFVEQMRIILRILSEALQTPVDVEFASDGQYLYLLQCRPQSQALQNISMPVPQDITEDKKIFSANKYVTDGYVPEIQYVVYVDPDEYDRLPSNEQMEKVGHLIGELNRKLPARKFILMGPGRWGSRGDIQLGVRVGYSDISRTSMLIEVAKQKKDYLPDLSFGTHFFQDLVESNIHYLPLYPDDNGIIFKEDWLKNSHNSLKDMIPHYAEMAAVVRVIDVQRISEGELLYVVMDGDKEFALAYLKNPES